MTKKWMNYSYFFGIYQKQNNKVAICSKSLSMFYEMFSRKTTRKLRVSPLGENVSNEKKLSVSGFLFYSFRRRFLCCFKKKFTFIRKEYIFKKRLKSFAFCVCVCTLLRLTLIRNRN